MLKSGSRYVDSADAIGASAQLPDADWSMWLTCVRLLDSKQLKLNAHHLALLSDELAVGTASLQQRRSRSARAGGVKGADSASRS